MARKFGFIAIGHIELLFREEHRYHMGSNRKLFKGPVYP